MAIPSTTPHTTASQTNASHGPGVLDWIALVLMIVGSINWGLVGVANLDLVALLFGQGSVLSRIVYALVGLAGLYGIVMAMSLNRRR